MTTDRYTRLRRELASLGRDFRREATRAATVHVEWVWDIASVTDDGWRTFAACYGQADLGERSWLFGGGGLFRLTGDPRRHDVFGRLADTGSLLLDHLSASRPQGAVTLPATGGTAGWLEAVFDTALAAATTRLRAKCGRWGLDDDAAEECEESDADFWAGSGDARHPAHPHVTTLARDVFTSSAAAIAVWLNPDRVVRIGDRLSDPEITFPEANHHHHSPPHPRPAAKPKWSGDDQFYRLWFGDTLVKEFRQPAQRQEAILDAFEAAGWPGRVDAPGRLAKESAALGHAVAGLNKYHANPGLLRFRRDGVGAGICWEWIGG